jgi:membrane-associated phospholipid phosphatase
MQCNRERLLSCAIALVLVTTASRAATWSEWTLRYASAEPDAWTPALVTHMGDQPLQARQIAASAHRFNWRRAWDCAGEDLTDLPDIVINETMEIGSDWDLLFPLLAAGGGSIALHNSGADARMERDIRDNRFLRKTMDEGTYLVGGPGFHFAAAGLWYFLAAGNEDAVGQEQAWTMLKALSVNGALTMVLKLARDNHTPNDKPLAWPSGHTSSSFTVAAVLDELYGPEVGIPAYIGAGFVGYRMMESGDHWPSDVLFGAVLGYVVGHHVAGKHRLPEVAGFQVVPWSSTDDGRTVTGIGLTRSF